MSLEHVTPRAAIMALRLDTFTPMADVDELMRGTNTVLVAKRGDMYLKEKGQYDLVVELGDYLVRVAGDVSIWTPAEFVKAWR